MHGWFYFVVRSYAYYFFWFLVCLFAFNARFKNRFVYHSFKQDDNNAMRSIRSMQFNCIRHDNKTVRSPNKIQLSTMTSRSSDLREGSLNSKKKKIGKVFTIVKHVSQLISKATNNNSSVFNTTKMKKKEKETMLEYNDRLLFLNFSSRLNLCRTI